MPPKSGDWLRTRPPPGDFLAEADFSPERIFGDEAVPCPKCFEMNFSGSRASVILLGVP